MDGKKLCEVIESAGYDARSYSGRGMYGRTCVGVTTDDSSFTLAAKLVREAFDLLGDDEAYRFADDLADLSVSEDAMGLSTIVYFPRVAWPADEDGDEEDDHDHDCEGDECCTPEGATAAAE